MDTSKLSPENSSSDLKIYCDLDGVLVDFLGAFRQLSGGKDWNDALRDLGFEEVWHLINHGGSAWWENLEWLSDGHKLWEFIRQFNPIILSAGATSRTGNLAQIGKKAWCARELGGSIEVIVADRGTDKKYWAKPGYILIDDLEENILVWKSRGGIGIHHQDALRTISELKQYMQSPQDKKSLGENWRAGIAGGMMALGALTGPGALPDASGASMTVPAVTVKRPAVPVKRPPVPVKRPAARASVPIVRSETENMNIFASTLIGEAGGEGIKGMQAVANVIMNRARGDFSKVGAVCLKPYQFSMWNGKRDQIKFVVHKAKAHARWKDAMLLIQQAKDGKLQDITGGSDFYFNPKLAMPKWANQFEKTYTIGQHDFYKHGKVAVSKFY